ncbi:MAG: SDR family NAD(P)-dependent oxidoreductase [Actinomycetota bacterium]|nr:SDR family NAD(P)-dependent oxidoreductase [Actinomycetota bacterium]
MDLGLDGKVALVTASSKGFGRASALALSGEGARVVICSRGEEALRETEGEMPGEVLAIVADVTEPNQPQRLVDAAVERFGGLDVLVANAGGPPPGRALEISDEQIEAAVNANLLSSVRLVRSALPHLRSAPWGRICLITSTAVKEPIPTLALSNTSRTGLWAWAKTAAKDLMDEDVTLNLACPGTHATERTRSLGTKGRMGDPEDFGRVVAFLCSEPAGFVSGVALQVDGADIAGLL